MSKPCLFLFCLITFFPYPAVSQDRAQCQRWSTQYQRYTDLRRAGGSTAEMDRWRDRQRQIEAQMHKARCMQRFRITNSAS